MNGSTPLPDRLKDKATHSLPLSDEAYTQYTSAKYFTETGVKSASEIAALELVEVNEALRVKAKSDRDDKLQHLTVEVGGHSIQVRPQDELNLRLQIQSMADGEFTDWILSDNTVASISKDDLSAAYALGLALGEDIYQDYKDIIKGL